MNDASAKEGRITLGEVERAVRGRVPVPWSGEGRPASVLVPLFERDGRVHVLLTERTPDLPTHGGQISFPGGKRDPDDADAVATALREAREETGLEPQAVRLLGLLDESPTYVSGFVITPVVGIIPAGYPYVPNSAEIAALLELPLDDFLRPGVLRTQPFEGFGRPDRLHFYSVGGHVVWGATARILTRFFELLGRPPAE